MAYRYPEEMERLDRPSAAAAGETAPSGQVGFSGSGEDLQGKGCGTQEEEHAWKGGAAPADPPAVRGGQQEETLPLGEGREPSGKSSPEREGAEEPVQTEGSEAGEMDESLAAEELLRCREELRRTREELTRLQESARREEKEAPRPSSRPAGPAMASQHRERPLPAFSRSLLSGGVEAGEDRYRQVMGL